MTENIHSIEQNPQENGDFDDIVAMQEADLNSRQTQLFESAPAEQPSLIQEKPKNPNARPFNKVGAGVAGAALLVASGAGLIAQNANSIEETKQTTTQTFVADQENGALIGPALEATEQLYEEIGLDPNSVPTSEVHAELFEAMNEHSELAGEALTPGDQFEVKLTSATGGLVTLGSEITDVDIVSVAAEKAKQAALNDTESK